MNILKKYIYLSCVALLAPVSLSTMEMEKERLPILAAISPTCQSEIFEDPNATISFLEAFMSGQFEFIGPTPVCLLYDINNNPKKCCSLETASEAIIAFQGYLSLLKNTGRRLPFMEELRTIKKASNNVDEFKKTYARRISDLDKNDLIQIELKRFSNFIKNRDLTALLKDNSALENEIVAIKKNRRKLKKGFLDQNSRKILTACISKLHTVKFVSLFDGLKNNIQNMSMITEENFKSKRLLS